MIEAGGTIDYFDSGEGPALLFLPGSYSTAAAWRPIQRLLGPGRRMVTTSLCGYGQSRDPRSLDDAGMHHEVALVEAICRRLDQPVHLVGHSFGGTVAMAAALAGAVPIASLSLFEANPIDCIRDRGAGALYLETLEMSRAFEAAVDAGEQDAPARIIDFWGRPGAFAVMPEAVKSYCRSTASVNVLDWRSAFAFRITPAQCCTLKVPVLLVRGALANPAMVQITNTLQEWLPHSRAQVVEGAGHFLISSHSGACAASLATFLEDVA